jgi:hypothetical protein
MVSRPGEIVDEASYIQLLAAGQRPNTSESLHGTKLHLKRTEYLRVFMQEIPDFAGIVRG